MVKEASQFLEQNREKPFFLYYALNTPHYPYQGEAKWLEHFKDLPYPRNLYAAFLATQDERLGEPFPKSSHSVSASARSWSIRVTTDIRRRTGRTTVVGIPVPIAGQNSVFLKEGFGSPRLSPGPALYPRDRCGIN